MNTTSIQGADPSLHVRTVTLPNLESLGRLQAVTKGRLPVALRQVRGQRRVKERQRGKVHNRQGQARGEGQKGEGRKRWKSRGRLLEGLVGEKHSKGASPSSVWASLQSSPSSPSSPVLCYQKRHWLGALLMLWTTSILCGRAASGT